MLACLRSSGVLFCNDPQHYLCLGFSGRNFRSEYEMNEYVQNLEPSNDFRIYISHFKLGLAWIGLADTLSTALKAVRGVNLFCRARSVCQQPFLSTKTFSTTHCIVQQFSKRTLGIHRISTHKSRELFKSAKMVRINQPNCPFPTKPPNRH